MIQLGGQPFLLGACISLSVAVPIGPVALLCIRRTLSDGLRTGVAGGVGAASVHLCYGTLALSGLGATGEFLRVNHLGVQLAGSVIAVLIAIRILLKNGPSEPATGGVNGPVLASYASTGLLALSNPMTILGLAAGLSAFGLVGAGFQWPVAAGMFCGSTLWWIVLCSGIAAFRHQFRPRTVLQINRSASALMALLGLFSIARLL